jgi:riboflavin synthase
VHQQRKDRARGQLRDAGSEAWIDEHELRTDRLRLGRGHLVSVLGKRDETFSSSLAVMFTGIVHEQGRVVSFTGGRLVVETVVEASVGDSVAIDGVCLTVVESEGGSLHFDVALETLARAKPFGAAVNVEPALRVGEPLGGHYVQGHVDGVGRVRDSEPEGDGRRLWIEGPSGLLRYLVDKGSVTVDGVSLTVAGLDDSAFAVALVPHTLEVTTLGGLGPGDEVNLEVDVLAKYVERLLGAFDNQPAQPGAAAG